MCRNSIQVSRQELYNQVWAEPVYKVAMKYGVSDVGLAKICNRNNIPKPPLGYWTKLAHGHKVPIPELPKTENEQPIRIVSVATQIGIEDPNLLTETSEKIAFEKRKENQIIVPKELTDIHYLTILLQGRLQRSSKDKDGFYTTSMWPEITVTEALIPRAILIMDTLLKALDARGYDDMEDFRIFDEPVDIWLHEHLDSKLKEGAAEELREDSWRKGYAPYDYYRVPSGKLTLTLSVKREGEGLQRNWTDGKSQRIETILNDFICGMTRQAAVSREWRLHWERWHREQEEEEQRQRDEALRRAREKARKNQLRNDAQNWELANTIRAYIDACTEKKETQGEEFKNWVDWARSEADAIDPLLSL